jgi:UDP-glucose 4-epimerase
MAKRIVFTGGSGKAGREVVPYLVEQGHEVLNLDLVPLDHPGVTTLTTDLRDSGEVFNALSMHFDFSGLESGKGPAPVDAVVHFAAVPRILLRPDNVTFQANAVST